MANYYLENGRLTKKSNKKGRNFVLGEDGRLMPTSPMPRANIAPTVTSKKKEEEEKDTWFKAGGFSDGVDGIGDFFGDLGQTILGTVGDIGVGIGKGVGGLVEGIADLGTYAVSGVSDLFGADEFAKDAKKFAEENQTNKLLKGAEDFVDQYSVLGNKSDNITQGLGYVAGILATGGLGASAGLGALGTTALTTGTTFASSMGGGMGEAYASGATDEEAVTYGAIKGAGDAVTELIFGGLGKAVKATGLSTGLSSADDILAKKLSSKITNQLSKNLVEYGVKAGAEGTEEVLAGIVSIAGKKATYLSEEELGKIIEDENLLEQFIAGAVTSGIAQSGYVPGMTQGSLREANKAGRDFISGYTANEQTVIDSEVDKRVKEFEKNGKKVDGKQKNKIIEEVETDLKKGFIGIDSIESALGGDTYKNYNSLLEESKEFETLYKTKYSELSEEQRDRLETLKEKNARKPYKSELESLEQRLSQEIDTNTQNDAFIRESFNEKARRKQQFEADLTKYDAKQAEIVKGAVESGILNNTTRTHEFVDMVAKISADKGVTFDFTNNKKLKESGFVIEGKTINGLVENGKIAVNINSQKALNTVVGHEITHVLEGTEFYTELQSAIFDYAKSKGEYKSRSEAIASLYDGILKGSEAEIKAKLDKELTADLVGDYLFTDSDFISRLSVEKPNIFKRIYEEIKYLVKTVTGNKEARELEKVKRAFDKAYKENGSGKVEEGRVYFSLANKNITKDSKIPIVESTDYKAVPKNDYGLLSDLQKEVKNLKRGTYENKATGYKANINAETINKILNPTQKFDPWKGHYLDNLNASRYLPTLFENAVYVDTKENQKPKNNNKDIEGFHHFVAPIRMNGNDYRVRITAREKANSDTLYIVDAEILQTKSNAVPNNKNGNISALPSDMSVSDLVNGVKIFDYNLQQNNVYSDADIKFSLSEDTSYMDAVKSGDMEIAQKIVDDVANKAGYTIKAYHGTGYDFTVFDKEMQGSNYEDWGRLGKGFYFAPKEKSAKMWAERSRGNNTKVMPVYLKSENMLDVFEALPDNLKDTIPADWDSLTKRLAEKYTYNYIEYMQEFGYDIQAILTSKGYDGITDNDSEYVVFDPEQVKSAEAVTYDDNGNVIPLSERFNTDNDDIRYSMSDSNSDITPTGKYNVYGKDIAFEAPVKETAPKKEKVDEYAPLTEEMANERDAQQSDRLYSLNESDMPEEVEAPIYDEALQNVEPESPFDDKDIQDVGNRKQKAYMYENPEVKPYFQEEAQNMLYELKNSVKGERVVDANLLYESNGEFGVWGTKRETSEQIAYMLDRFKYTYADIEKGLNAIIEDHGAENNAISKRLEFMIDERLREGYTDFLSGTEIPSNQEYINLLNAKQISDYSDEAYNKYLESLAYAEAPAEDIAPVAENVKPVTEDITPTDGVQRSINLETGEIVDEDTTLDKAKRRINRKLAEEKSKAYEEFKVKMDSLQKELGSRDKYVSDKALELYEELSNLKKGVKASDELGYLLDFGFKWQELKTALLHTKAFPASTYNENSAVESLVREAIGREYDSRLYEIDELEAEYQNHVNELKANAENEIAELESGNKRKTHGEIQRAYVENIKQTFSKAGLDFDKVLENAKNKSTFASVDNTPQRYIEKTLGYKEGQILNDLTINQEASNESKAIKWLNSFTSRKDGELAKISKMYGIKPNSKEDAGAQMYAEGFYINEQNEYVEYGDAELAKDFPDVRTQNRIKGLVNNPRIREIYDKTLEQINESRVRNGYPEIPRRDNYYLHFRAMDDTFSRLGIPFNPNDIRAKDLPTDINGMTADLKPGQPYFASANQRRGLKTSHSLLGGMERYLTSAKNQIYHIDDIQTLRGLRNYIADMYGQAHGLENLDTLTEEEAEARVKEVYDAHLSTFAKFLNEQANVLAGKTSLIDRGLEGVIGRRGIQTLNTINTQVAKNMVGFNVSSALTGFVSTVQGFAKSNKYDAVKAFAQVASNRMKSIFGNSDGFAENNPAMIRRKGAEKFYRTPYERISDLGYTLMSGVDNLSTEFIIRAKYNELTRKGMDSDKAHEEAGKWAMRILGDRSLGQQPQLYNSKMLGLVTKFQLEVRNQLDSMVYDTVQEAKLSNEEIDNRLAKNAKTAVKVASTMAQLAVFQHIFGKAFESVAGYNPTFDIVSTLMTLLGLDDDEEKEDTVFDNAEQALLDLLEDLPYTSTLTGGRIPIQSALPIEQLIKGEDDYGNEKSRWETLKETAPYYLMPGGYNQIKKTTQGLGMFSDEHPVSGSYTDSGNLRFPVEDTTENRIHAGIFGQWANENARDYFDNERKPLKEKQIEEFAELDIPIKDYWKYREGLTKQDTLEEKFDYVAGLDFPVEKKNIMINNIVDRKEPVDLTNYDDFADYEEFDFAVKNAEKYEFLQSINVSYKDYIKNDETKEAYNWAYQNPEKYVVSKAVGDVVTYRRYAKEINEIESDKDENGKTINGSKKEKVTQYIDSLNAEYGAKIILFKSLYKADDTYNNDIVEYLNNRDDITYNEMVTILTELDFNVSADGTVWWD